MYQYAGGRAIFGETVGIVVERRRRPRPPGDVGNATTFDFPVRFATIAPPPWEAPGRQGEASLEPALAAVAELEAAGALAVVVACESLAPYQRELAAAARVPAFTTSLVQLPLVYELLCRQGRIGVIAAETGRVDGRLLESVGAADVPVAVAGMEAEPGFRAAVLEDGLELDFERIQAEIVRVASRLVSEHHDVRALVLEGPCLPPYARAIQRATERPVFDVVTLVNTVQSAIQAETFPLFELRHGPAWWRSARHG